MDNGGQHENERQRTDLYKGVQPPLQWNMMPQYQMKEANALVMNKKLMHIISEKNAATQALNRAIIHRNSAIEERNEAIKLRDEAIIARDTVYRERDSAIAALRFHESSINGPPGTIRRGTKRMHDYTEYHVNEGQYTDAMPLSAVDSDDDKMPFKANSNIRENKSRARSVHPKTPVSNSPRKGKRVGEDLNRQVTTQGSKAEWEAQELALMGEIIFDENKMPAPVCSCTGVPRHCYKWGSGGWQSACCTTSLSVYPLPQLQNKRYTRMGGRKMSGNVFSRLLTRVTAEGHDLSIPLDLKNYWAKHGTNRYITIK